MEIYRKAVEAHLLWYLNYEATEEFVDLNIMPVDIAMSDQFSQKEKKETYITVSPKTVQTVAKAIYDINLCIPEFAELEELEDYSRQFRSVIRDHGKYKYLLNIIHKFCQKLAQYIVLRQGNCIKKMISIDINSLIALAKISEIPELVDSLKNMQ
jgi:hypothetical protein